MAKYYNFFRVLFFTLMLYLWTSEVILFPGEKQGEDKKSFVLSKFNELVDEKLPNIPWIDAIQAMISKLLSDVIDKLVAKMKAQADLAKLQAEIAAFFSPAPAISI